MVTVKIIESIPELEYKYNSIIHEINCRPQPSSETTLLLDGKQLKVTDTSEIIIDNYNIWIDGIAIDLRNIANISSNTTVK